MFYWFLWFLDRILKFYYFLYTDFNSNTLYYDFLRRVLSIGKPDKELDEIPLLLTTFSRPRLRNRASHHWMNVCPARTGYRASSVPASGRRASITGGAGFAWRRSGRPVGPNGEKNSGFERLPLSTRPASRSLRQAGGTTRRTTVDHPRLDVADQR